MEEKLQRISTNIWLFMIVTYLSAMLLSWKIGSVCDDIKKEYTSVKVEVSEFIKSTKADIHNESQEFQELIDNLQELQEGKIVTMRRERGRYIISIEEKNQKDSND